MTSCSVPKNELSKISLPDKKLFIDHVGRLHFDSCDSDLDHLIVPTSEGIERRTCRYYLEDLFPESMRGSRGYWEISVRFSEEPLSLSRPTARVDACIFCKHLEPHTKTENRYGCTVAGCDCGAHEGKKET